MDRTGIGDAELARRIPVSRPTLVRWKEGVTARPRYRDDVLRCAELLRLSSEERDEFLLAAGFSPETAVPADQAEVVSEQVEFTADSALAPVGEDGDSEEAAAPTEHPVDPDSGSPVSRRRVRIAIGVGIAALAIVVVAALAVFGLVRRDDGDGYPVAMPDESLIVLAPFVNYTAGQQGFNVLGRLRDEIDREIAASGLSDARSAQWPTSIFTPEEAESVAVRSGATILIWGEYDSGRVMARFTTPGIRTASRDDRVVDIASTPDELPAAINAGLPEEARAAALLTLGQLYLERGKHDDAKKVLIQALARPPSDPLMLASLRFQLGRAYQGGALADFDEAIWLFTQTLEVTPDSVEAYNSRALAYLSRNRAGDADLAVEDLTRAVSLEPKDAASYLNLAVAHIERGSDGDLALALAALDEALALRPDYAAAHVNRAAAYLSRDEPGDLELAFDAIAAALSIESELPYAYLNRGNAYLARGEDGDLELAVAEFSRAIEMKPDSARGHFNRGLALSALDDLDGALADLRRAQELDPANLTFNSSLCWQLAVAGQPEDALAYCDIAVSRDASGQTADSRALVYALLGRNDEAIADFRVFLKWVEASPKPTCAEYYRPSRSGWIDELSAGQNPFDPQTLRALRVRPTSPSASPC